MAQYGYSIELTENRAHACMRDIPVSYKAAAMIATRIKGMPAEKALRFLRDVQTQKRAVPFTKFNDSFGHKPGIGPGRYPQKAAKLFEMLVSNAVANAEDKGLGKEVAIEFVVAQQASRPWRHRSSGRHKFKRAHVEIVVTNAPAESSSMRSSLNRKRETKTRTKAPKKEAAPVAAKENVKESATETKATAKPETKAAKETKEASKQKSQDKENKQEKTSQ